MSTRTARSRTKQPGPRTPRRTVRSGRTPARRRRPSRRRTLDPALTAELRRAARTFGLSVDEYVRLVVAVSGALRKSVLGDQTLDGQGLLSLVQQPLFQGMMGWITKSLAGQFAALADPNKSPAETPQQDGTSTPDPPESAPSRPDPAPSVRETRDWEWDFW